MSMKKPPLPSGGILIGYARVSTEEQNLDMQVAALEKAGVHRDHIHVEKVSGVAKRRPGRDLAVKDMREGDTLVVWKLDRVGRNLRDLLAFLDMLEERGIGFRSLQDSIDTSTPAGRVMLAMLGAFAQFERDLISERTRAGVRQAKADGKKFGQPPKVTPENHVAIERAIHKGEPLTSIAKRYKMSVGCLRTWYPRPVLDWVREHGPLAEPPKQKRKA